MSYRDNDTYKALENIVMNAGVTVVYRDVPDDPIDGAIWARADPDSNRITMPMDDNAFPDDETACLILGHEMGHILTNLDSPDDPIERRKNEAVCDLVGVYLFRLAEETASFQAEKWLRDQLREQ